MASLPNERGGLYMVQMLNLIIIMLNGLLDFAITNVLLVAFAFFYSQFSAPEGDFHISYTFSFFDLAARGEDRPAAHCELFYICEGSH